VGGGPAGAATAWMLARNGIDVFIVDKARFPREKPCAEYLNPRALRVIAEMGALGEIERAGVGRIEGMRVHPAGGDWFEGRFGAAGTKAGFRDHGIGARREVVDAALLSSARTAGATVEEETAVQEIVRDASGGVIGVRVRAGSGSREIRARHVVGADGLRSVVARRLGLARRSVWPTRYAFVTHLTGITTADRGEMHVFADGYCGLAPVGNGVTNFAIVVPSRLAKAAAGDAERFVSEWIARHGTIAARLAGANRVAPVLVTGPFASGARRAWTHGATLVGDAADFFDPFTGEGICAALRGAELLAPYIVESLRAVNAREARAALEAYDRCRRDEFAAKWRLERLVACAVAWPALLDMVGARLRGRRDLADMLVGATGGIVPASDVVSLRFASQLFALGAP
jgi:2-polyprenyl-6-methoxyphenol hydroxylase-like FAD-dependent oxidoreductase